jgi:hypothetical protein
MAEPNSTPQPTENQPQRATDPISGQPYLFISLIDARVEIITNSYIIYMLQRYGDHDTFTLTKYHDMRSATLALAEVLESDTQ